MVRELVVVYATRTDELNTRRPSIRRLGREDI